MLGSALLSVSAVRPSCGVTNRLLPGKVHTKRGFVAERTSPHEKPALQQAAGRRPAQPNQRAGGGRGWLQLSPRFSGGFSNVPIDLVRWETSQRSWGSCKAALQIGSPPLSLPCRAAFVVSCPPLSQGVLKSPSSSSPPAPPYGALRSQETLQRARPSPSNCFFQVPLL